MKHTILRVSLKLYEFFLDDSIMKLVYDLYVCIDSFLIISIMLLFLSCVCVMLYYFNYCLIAVLYTIRYFHTSIMLYISVNVSVAYYVFVCRFFIYDTYLSIA